MALGAARGGLEQGALEGQDGVAVARGALGKQDQIVARVQAAGHLVAVQGGVAHPALDEDGLLQAREPGEKRPGGHLRLGDEGSLQQRAEHLDIEVGDVVGHIERRMAARRLAVALDLDAEQAAGAPVVPERQPFAQRRSEEHTSELQSLMRISYAVFVLNKTIITSSIDCIQATKTYSHLYHYLIKY